MGTCQKCWWQTDFSLCEGEEVDSGNEMEKLLPVSQPAAMTSMILTVSPWICLQPSSSCEYSIAWFSHGPGGFRV